MGARTTPAIVLTGLAAMDKAGIGKDKTVKLHARNVRIVEAVWAILIETGGLGKVGCERKDGKLVIGGAHEGGVYSTRPSPVNRPARQRIHVISRRGGPTELKAAPVESAAPGAWRRSKSYSAYRKPV